MKKKLLFFLLILAALWMLSYLAFVALEYLPRLFDNHYDAIKIDLEKLSGLRGEIVYAKRDKYKDEYILNIYKISANGTGKKLLYHHDNPVNANCSFPEWSEDGLKIYFQAYSDGGWKVFSIDPDGNGLRVEEGRQPDLLSRDTRSDDIIWDKGSLFYINEAGNKIQVFRHRKYQVDWNHGANEASWSPDKQYIIFEVDNNIFVASRQGDRLLRITEGESPDWKY